MLRARIRRLERQQGKLKGRLDNLKGDVDDIQDGLIDEECDDCGGTHLSFKDCDTELEDDSDDESGPASANDDSGEDSDGEASEDKEDATPD